MHGPRRQPELVEQVGSRASIVVHRGDAAVVVRPHRDPLAGAVHVGQAGALLAPVERAEQAVDEGLALERAETRQDGHPIVERQAQFLVADPQTEFFEAHFFRPPL